MSFETVYAYEAAAAGDAGGDEGLTAATTTLRFENKPEKGLGQPLPQGAVWLRQTQSPGGELFIGSKTIDDVAIGAPFEIALGAASDVTVHARVVSDTHAAPHRRRLSFTVEVANAKPRPVVLEIRQPVSDVTGLAVPEESLAHGTKGGDPLWRLPLPANATATLTYSLEFDD